MKLFIAILVIASIGMWGSLYIGIKLGQNQIGLDCLRLGAFELRGQFYNCDLVVKNYVESEDFK
ncbi:hypothetical protein D3C75_465240 [compost metagenome]